MNQRLQKVLEIWNHEVAEQMATLIEEGTPPEEAEPAAVKIVATRRVNARRAEAPNVIAFAQAAVTPLPPLIPREPKGFSS